MFDGAAVMAQRDLESISEALRIPGSKSLGPVARSVKRSENIIKDKKNDIISAFAAEKKVQAELFFLVCSVIGFP